MIYLRTAYISIIVIVGYAAGLLLERYKQNKIKNELEEKIYNLSKYNFNLGIELDEKDIFINNQTRIIDKLRWENAEKDIIKQKFDKYRRHSL